MESNSQMPSQSIRNQGQYSPLYEEYSASPQEGYPQMPSQQGQYPPPSYQGYPPSVQGYPQISPNQPPYQPMSSLPNQRPALGPRSGRSRCILHSRGRGLTMMLRGVILIVGGITLSLISYSCASSVANNGGTGYYTVFTGAVIIGAIYAIFGFFRWILGR